MKQISSSKFDMAVTDLISLFVSLLGGLTVDEVIQTNL